MGRIILTTFISPLGKTTSLPGMEQPFYYWIPSIAPSGMAFSTSNIYGDWKDDLFVGSLKFEYLERLVIKENKVVKREKILDGIGRVRNVVEGPDGYLYLGIEGTGIVSFADKMKSALLIYLSFCLIAFLNLRVQKSKSESIKNGAELYRGFLLSMSWI